jgi:hypothetical protein
MDYELSLVARWRSRDFDVATVSRHSDSSSMHPAIGGDQFDDSLICGERFLKKFDVAVVVAVHFR